MKKCFRSIVFALVILMAASPLVYFGKTGKLDLGFGKARATAETYTVQGYVIDSITEDPLSGRTVTISSPGVSNVQDVTDEYGYYSGEIEVEPGNLIRVQEDLGARYIGMEENIVAPAGGGEINRIFHIANKPFTDAQLDAFLANLNDNDPKFAYKIITVNNHQVVFTTLKSMKYRVVLDNYTDNLTRIAQQIDALRTATNVDNATPEMIMITSVLDWTNNPSEGAIEARSKPEDHKIDMYLNMSVVSDPETGDPWLLTVVHEFNHIIDWVKGRDKVEGDFLCDDLLEWCPASSDNAIVEAAMVLTGNFGYDNTSPIFGNAKKNIIELFADLGTWMLPNLDRDIEQSADPNQRPSYILPYWLWNDRAQNADSIFLTPISFLRWGQGHTLAKALEIHNSLMYMAEVVRNYTNLEAIFPRNIVSNANYTEGTIKDGTYMGDQAVATLKLDDHFGAPLEDAIVLFDTTSGDTEAPHIGGYVFNAVGTGEQTLDVSPPENYPVPFVGQNFNLVHGANFLEANYHSFLISYKVYDSIDEEQAKFRGIFEANNEQGVTGLLLGSIPLYENDGYSSPNPANGNGGYGVLDTGLNALIPPEDEGEYLFYKIHYVIGGGGDELFPIKETFIGPAGSVVPLAGNPSQFAGITENSYDPRPPAEPYAVIGTYAFHTVEGTFLQRCFYDTEAQPNFCATINPPDVGWAVPDLP